MPNTKSISETQAAIRSFRSSPLHISHFESSSIPISPKIQELRARYEAIRAKERDLKLPKSDK